MIDKRVVPMSLDEAPLAWLLTSQPLPVSESAARNWLTGEPNLQDLLADPLVHAVLRRDGLSLQDLQRAIALGRRRLAPAERHLSASTAA